MRWALTGTPGTGKTSIASQLSIPFPVVHLNDVIEAHDLLRGRDEDRDTMVVDLPALCEWVREQPEAILIESHIAHLLPVDNAIVLRCHPNTLHSRLATRQTPESSIGENLASERLDLILAEAIDQLGEQHIYEVDTTEKSIDTLVDTVESMVAGSIPPRSGIVSFLEEP